MTNKDAIESFKHSNEQAKVRLEVEKMRMDNDEIKELEFYIERDEIAIKALEQEPCEDMTTAYLMGYYADKEPCGDAIDRAEAIKIASGYCHPANVAKELAKLPPVTPQPKTGHWIEHPEIETITPEYLMFYECSECGDRQCFCKSDIHKKRFCGNCGCRMVEPQERSDKE